MKMKIMFFMFSIAWILCVEHTVHAMKISQKKHKAYIQKTRNFCTDTSKFGLEENSAIVHYKTERDAVLIEPIAFKYMHKLQSDVTDKNRLEELNKLMAVLSRNTTISKVYLINGKAAGFINYYISQPPWYQRFTSYPLRSKAYINCLAIDDTQQGKGIGTALLEDALQDCEKQPVHSIFLSTTGCDSKLKKYYSKFGFSWAGGSKYTGVDKFKKSLAPYPKDVLKKVIFDWLRSSQE